MFTFAQQSAAARRLLALAAAATVAAGAAGTTLVAADDAHAIACDPRGSSAEFACIDAGERHRELP